MKIIPSDLPDVLIIEPNVYADPRGYFLETWNQASFARAGLNESFVQDNHSFSTRGVLRGLHYQLRNPQGKLVRAVRGKVWDVAVDIRVGSPTYSRWVGVELSDENHRQLYVPPGFAHGFCVLSDSADFVYKCTDFYDPDDEHGLIWNDPDFGIEWPGTDFVISDKDANSGSAASMQSLLPRYSKTP